MTRNRRRMGCMTISQDVDVDIYMRDIISSLSDFDTDELEDLRDAVDKEIGDTKDFPFIANNLEDEQKIKILKDLFSKYTWKELEEIKNIYENHNRVR
jgi:hypothetical protein